MDICLIWAQARNRAIGKAGALPWHAPADLRHFKTTTNGSPVIMGRRTWESLPFKPLPGRQNFVVASRPVDNPGAVRCSSLQNALELAATARPARVFVIGGQALYEQAIKVADVLYVTQVAADVADADAFAPVIDESRFELVSQENGPSTEPCLVFETYQRRRHLR